MFIEADGAVAMVVVAVDAFVIFELSRVRFLLELRAQPKAMRARVTIITGMIQLDAHMHEWLVVNDQK